MAEYRDESDFHLLRWRPLPAISIDTTQASKRQHAKKPFSGLVRGVRKLFGRKSSKRPTSSRHPTASIVDQLVYPRLTTPLPFMRKILVDATSTSSSSSSSFHDDDFSSWSQDVASVAQHDNDVTVTHHEDDVTQQHEEVASKESGIDSAGSCSTRSTLRSDQIQQLTIDCLADGFIGLAVGGMRPVRVRGVESGGAGYRAGFLVGDAIIQIGGRDVAAATPEYVVELIGLLTSVGQAPVITVVRLFGDDRRRSDIGDELPDDDSMLSDDGNYWAECDDENDGVDGPAMIRLYRRLVRQFHDDSCMAIHMSLGIKTYVRPIGADDDRLQLLSPEEHAVLFRNIEKLAQIVAARRRLLSDAVQRKSVASSNGADHLLSLEELSERCDRLSRVWIDAYRVFESGRMQAIQMYEQLTETRPRFVEFARVGHFDTGKFAILDLDHFLRLPTTLTHRHWFADPTIDTGLMMSEEQLLEAVERAAELHKAALRYESAFGLPASADVSSTALEMTESKLRSSILCPSSGHRAAGYGPARLFRRLVRQFHDDSCMAIHMSLGIKTYVQPIGDDDRLQLSPEEHAVLFRNIEKLAQIIAARRRLLSDAVQRKSVASSGGADHSLSLDELSEQCDRLSRIWIDAYRVFESGRIQAIQMYEQLIETRPRFVEFARVGHFDTGKFAILDLDHFLRLPTTLTHRHWFADPTIDTGLMMSEEQLLEAVERAAELHKAALRYESAFGLPASADVSSTALEMTESKLGCSPVANDSISELVDGESNERQHDDRSDVDPTSTPGVRNEIDAVAE